MTPAPNRDMLPGTPTRVKEEARDRWSVPWLDHLQQDVRYAFRGLRRSPGFTATVILTLGLGIGANAAMFGVIDRLMFRPFPYLRDPAQVHRVYLQTTARGRILTRSIFPYSRYLDLQKATNTFSQYAAVSQRLMAVGSGEAARELEVAGVSASFFDFFDARPVLGRFFGASEDVTPRGASVVVLNHGFWQAAFGAKDVVGQRLQVGTVVTTIIGVAPRNFVGVTSGESPAVFIPITTFPEAAGENKTSNYFTIYNWDWVSVIVRRKPGVTSIAASTDLSNAHLQSRIAQRVLNPEMTPPEVARPRAMAGALKTAAGPEAGLESKTLLWVTGAAVIVLLIACANVTNLMFARILRRRREIAMRLALGVSRRRLVAQSFMESVILATAGCVCGILLAQWGGAALRVLFIRDGSRLDVVTDWRTLAVACAFALGVAVLTGIGPALLAVRSDLASTLRAGAREGTYQRSRTRTALLVLQAALSVILLVGAGLFVRSLGNARSLRLGYDAEPVLMVTPVYRGQQMDSMSRVVFRRQLLGIAQAIPGVVYAARVNSRPFGSNTHYLYVPGIDSVPRLGRFNFQRATPDYFKVMGTRIVRGRPYTAEDREGGRLVVVVSEAMGRVLWPGQDALGQCIRVGANTMPCTTVIGIAEDAVHNSLTDDQRFIYYLPLDQTEPAGGNQIFLRMAGRNASAFIERVRHELQRVMPAQGYVTVQSLGELVDDQRRSWHLGATMFVAFGVLALIVAAVGLYGVLTYNVAQRMHELGVRIALGARPADVVRLVVGQGVSFAMAGVAIGLGLALLAAQWIEPLLFEQSARDPVTYGGVGALIMLVACLASAMPAFRAIRADPNAALRSD